MLKSESSESDNSLVLVTTPTPSPSKQETSLKLGNIPRLFSVGLPNKYSQEEVRSSTEE